MELNSDPIWDTTIIQERRNEDTHLGKGEKRKLYENISLLKIEANYDCRKKGLNKSIDRNAMKAVSMALLILSISMIVPFYISVVLPILNLFPSTIVPTASVSQYVAFVLVYGHAPGYGDWVNICLAAGLGWFFAVCISGALAALGLVGTSIVLALLTASGIGIPIAAAIIAG